MRESFIERFLVKEVKKRGGLALKFTSPGLSGVPDRIVLMKNGKVVFIELKAPGKKLRLLQEKRKRQLEHLGFKVFVIDSRDVIEGTIDEIQST